MSAAGPTAEDTPIRVSRIRQWTTRLLWLLAAFAFFGGLVVIVHGLTFPRAVADDPVRIEAKITAVYINGFGGDPAVNYQYRVAGRVYSGSGNGELGDETLLNLHPGDPVAIEYSAKVPSQSCTCDPLRSAPLSIPLAVLLGALLALPLAILTGRRVRASSRARSRLRWL
jgi:hypothetical protein